MSETAIFAAGCFWGVQDAFDMIDGVTKTTVGYTGGHVKDPYYEEVCTNTTGHAEAVEVEFDPSKVTYEKLLDAFWKIHNPTTLNRQGPDVGTQYRSAIFYLNDNQKILAEKSKEALQQTEGFKERKIVTEITKATDFYKAEEYHQKYFQKNGVSACHI